MSMEKKRTIAKLYKPDYIQEKREIETIDGYIKFEGKGFIGKLFTANKDLVRWRVKSKSEKGKINQNEIYEMKQIVKRYNFDMKQKAYGYSQEYVNTMTDLLYKKKGKKYLHLRRLQLKERQKNYKKNKNDNDFQATTFYITSQKTESNLVKSTVETQEKKMNKRLLTEIQNSSIKSNNSVIELNINEDEYMNTSDIINKREDYIEKMKQEYQFFQPKVFSINNNFELKSKRRHKILFNSGVTINYKKYHCPFKDEFFNRLNRRMETESSEHSSRTMLPKIYRNLKLHNKML